MRILKEPGRAGADIHTASQCRVGDSLVSIRLRWRTEKGSERKGKTKRETWLGRKRPRGARREPGLRSGPTNPVRFISERKKPPPPKKNQWYPIAQCNNLTKKLNYF